MTWSEIVAERQRQAHEREQQALSWAREVSERIHAEQSQFLKEFNEAEARILGLIK
jgi:hypothetical protein